MWLIFKFGLLAHRIFLGIGLDGVCCTRITVTPITGDDMNLDEGIIRHPVVWFNCCCRCLIVENKKNIFFACSRNDRGRYTNSRWIL
jgi:hypothetical protein